MRLLLPAESAGTGIWSQPLASRVVRACPGSQANPRSPSRTNGGGRGWRGIARLRFRPPSAGCRCWPIAAVFFAGVRSPQHRPAPPAPSSSAAVFGRGLSLPPSRRLLGPRRLQPGRAQRGPVGRQSRRSVALVSSVTYGPGSGRPSHHHGPFADRSWCPAPSAAVYGGPATLRRADRPSECDAKTHPQHREFSSGYVAAVAPR